MSEFHGKPCWYELGTTDLESGVAFYTRIFGWTVGSAGMEGFDYRLAKSDGDMVAGMMALEAQADAPPPNWLTYIATDDCDGTVAAIGAAGGGVLKAPADIPGTGRFAVVSDPQGAVFGLLQPLPMDGGGAGNAFDQSKAGHGNWHELMTTDPAAAFDFYAGLFGWTKGAAIDMDAMGVYQLFQHGGTDIGGIMGLGAAPVPAWLPYFGSDDVQATMDEIAAAGGKVTFGPIEVPGPAHIAVCTDPQGAWFAIVGPKP